MYATSWKRTRPRPTARLSNTSGGIVLGTRSMPFCFASSSTAGNRPISKLESQHVHTRPCFRKRLGAIGLQNQIVEFLFPPCERLLFLQHPE